IQAEADWGGVRWGVEVKSEIPIMHSPPRQRKPPAERYAARTSSVGTRYATSGEASSAACGRLALAYPPAQVNQPQGREDVQHQLPYHIPWLCRAGEQESHQHAGKECTRDKGQTMGVPPGRTGRPAPDKGERQSRKAKASGHWSHGGERGGHADG